MHKVLLLPTAFHATQVNTTSSNNDLISEHHDIRRFAVTTLMQ